MAYYPAELPNPLRSSFGRNQTSNTIRSQMDIGEAKVRKRYTLPIYSESWTLALDTNAVAFFNTWFNITLESGVHRFQFNDSISQTIQDYRIVDMPSFKPYGTCGSYTVSFNVERLP